MFGVFLTSLLLNIYRKLVSQLLEPSLSFANVCNGHFYGNKLIELMEKGLFVSVGPVNEYLCQVELRPTCTTLLTLIIALEYNSC